VREKARLLIVALALLFAFEIDLRQASACFCTSPASPITSYQQAANVFSGKVRQSGDSFEIYKTWKGEARESLAIRNGGLILGCDYRFDKSEEYLVYAQEQTNGLRVFLCSRTQPLAGASFDLVVLDAIRLGPFLAILGSVLAAIAVVAKTKSRRRCV
jgi:hypothetical protein